MTRGLDAWLVWRRALVAPRIAPLLQRDATAREHIKPEALWEHDQAQGTNVMDLMRAGETRCTFLQQLLALFERADAPALALPDGAVLSLKGSCPPLANAPR